MRCLTACFHTLKHREEQKSRKRTALQHLIHEKCEEAPIETKSSTHLQNAELIKTILQSKDENEEKLNSGSREKLTFSLDVKSKESCPTKKVAERIEENEKKVEDKKEESKENEADAFLDLITSNSSYVPYSPKQRCHNSTSKDFGGEDLELNESDLEDDVTSKGDGVSAQEESSESLFSISLDSKKQVFVAELGDKEVNSPLKPCYTEKKSKGLNPIAKERSQYVHSVLNPVENLNQWKAVMVKAEPITMNLQGKENIMLPFSEESDLKQQPIQEHVRDKPNKKENEAGVDDTSLSSWLVENEKTPNTKTSPGSVCNSSESINTTTKFQDETIPGTLTDIEFKQFSASSSPRLLQGHSRDDTPMIGTVGSYLMHTRQATDSCSDSSARGHSGSSREFRALGETSGHSTPLHTRLDKALESGVV